MQALQVRKADAGRPFRNPVAHLPFPPSLSGGEATGAFVKTPRNFIGRSACRGFIAGGQGRHKSVKVFQVNGPT